MQAQIEKLKLNIGIELATNNERNKHIQETIDVTTQSLQELERQLKDAKMLQARLETRNDALQKRLEEKKIELKNCDIHYEHLEKTYYTFENNINDYEQKIQIFRQKNEDYNEKMIRKRDECGKMSQKFKQVEKESLIYEEKCKIDIEEIENQKAELENLIKEKIGNNSNYYRSIIDDYKTISLNINHNDIYSVFNENKYNYLEFLGKNLNRYHRMKLIYESIKSCLDKKCYMIVNIHNDICDIYKQQPYHKKITCKDNFKNMCNVCNLGIVHYKEERRSGLPKKYYYFCNYKINHTQYQFQDIVCDGTICNGDCSNNLIHLSSYFNNNHIKWVKNNILKIIEQYTNNKSLIYLANNTTFDELFKLFKDSTLFDIDNDPLDFLNLIIFIGSNGNCNHMNGIYMFKYNHSQQYNTNRNKYLNEDTCYPHLSDTISSLQLK